MEWDLPETLLYGYLDTLDWLPGPLDGFEICELGLVRRPPLMPKLKGEIRPGYLSSPECRTEKMIRYRLNSTGFRNCTYIKPVDAMTEVFGKFRNKNLLILSYVKAMKGLVAEYNVATFRTPVRKTENEKVESGMMQMRRCTTCGKKTRDYRCSACWAKIKNGVTSCDDVAEEHRVMR